MIKRLRGYYVKLTDIGHKVNELIDVVNQISERLPPIDYDSNKSAVDEHYIAPTSCPLDEEKIK